MMEDSIKEFSLHVSPGIPKRLHAARLKGETLRHKMLLITIRCVSLFSEHFTDVADVSLSTLN